MTELLERAIAQVRALSADAQEEAAHRLLDWADEIAREVDDRPPEPIDPADRAALDERTGRRSRRPHRLRGGSRGGVRVLQIASVTIRYADRPRRDLAQIGAYLQPLNPAAADRVGYAIRRCI